MPSHPGHLLDIAIGVAERLLVQEECANNSRDSGGRRNKDQTADQTLPGNSALFVHQNGFAQSSLIESATWRADRLVDGWSLNPGKRPAGMSSSDRAGLGQ